VSVTLTEFVLLKIASIKALLQAQLSSEISYHVREISTRDHAHDFVVLIDHHEVPQTHGAEQLKHT
jgi:hypothetical protein